MKMSDFAQKMESYCDMTPTEIINVIVGDENIEKDWKNFFLALTGHFSSTGLGPKNLLVHVATCYGLEDDLNDLVDDSGGFPEFVYDWSDNTTSEGLDIDIFTDVLSQVDIVNARRVFMNFFEQMNALERKWFTAIIVNQTRNGAGENVTKKSLPKKYGINTSDFNTAIKFNRLSTIIDKVTDGWGVGDLLVPSPGNYIKPQLAKTAKSLKGEYYADVKYDGIRAQFHRTQDGKVMIFNRKGDDITNKFADLNIESWGMEFDWFILDGEIIPVDEDGKILEFKEIMPRIHGKTEAVRNRVAVKAIIFDILTYNGQDTYAFGYGTRLETLQMHFPNVNITETKLVTGEEAIRKEYNKAIKAGYEGLVLKGANQQYEPGKRSWLKHKPALVDLDCIVLNATMGSGKRAGTYGSYELGVMVDNQIISIGSVGTGFTDNDLDMVHSYYNNNSSTIMEVHADIVTEDKEGNIGLRFPRFIRLRTDKETPTEFKSVKELLN
jgi:DNA ligase-1